MFVKVLIVEYKHRSTGLCFTIDKLSSAAVWLHVLYGSIETCVCIHVLWRSYDAQDKVASGEQFKIRNQEYNQWIGQ
jgi:hypothetical protein